MLAFFVICAIMHINAILFYFHTKNRIAHRYINPKEEYVTSFEKKTVADVLFWPMFGIWHARKAHFVVKGEYAGEYVIYSMWYDTETKLFSFASNHRLKPTTNYDETIAMVRFMLDDCPEKRPLLRMIGLLKNYKKENFDDAHLLKSHILNNVGYDEA